MIRLVVSPALASAAMLSLGVPLAGAQARIDQAIIGESNPITPEISTAELRQILDDGKIQVLDVRSPEEYAVAHIPGSVNYYEKEVDALARAYPDKRGELVFYCNGPYCGKSKRLSEELVKRGYTGVRRYQLGLPVWRALGNTVQTDLAGARYIMSGDRTAVWVDARDAAAFQKGTVARAVNISKGQAEAANEDGRLPKKDKGTRIVVFGETPEQARVVAQEIAHKAYWNSSYFGGRFADLGSMASR